MAETDLLTQAYEALRKYSEQTPCPICKRYGEQIAQAAKDLSEVHAEGERVVRQLAEKKALQRAGEHSEKLKEEHGAKSAGGSASLFDLDTMTDLAPHNVLRLFFPEELAPHNVVKTLFGREEKRT